jgi:hypothetical protein
VIIALTARSEDYRKWQVWCWSWWLYHKTYKAQIIG